MATHVLLFLGLVLGETGAPPPSAHPAARALEPPAIAPAAAQGDGNGDGEARSARERSAAQAALADGNRHLKDGDVAGAIADYRRAQSIYPPAAAKIEFNIGKAEAARGDEPAAAKAFERFLAQSLEIPPEYREEARNELRRLSAALGALHLDDQRPGYEVVIDGLGHGKTPLDGDLWVRPGRHVITLEQDHHVLFRDDVQVVGGGTVQVTVTIRQTDAAGNPVRPPGKALALGAPGSIAATPAPAASGPAPIIDRPTVLEAADRPFWKRWWFWTAAGAVVAGSAMIWILSARDNCPSSASCKSVSIPPGP